LSRSLIGGDRWSDWRLLESHERAVLCSQGAVPVESRSARPHPIKRILSTRKQAMTDNHEIQKFETGKLKLKVTLAADRNAVDPVVQSVMDVVRQVHCDAEKYDAIELALTEALANAVVHGAKADPSKIVECDVVCNEDESILIVVRDPGTGFKPGEIPNPLQGESVYSDHGRGIFLINQLMDEVKFLKNGTEIHMIKK
jgi:serine/threonine-protein kinase RsbW